MSRNVKKIVRLLAGITIWLYILPPNGCFNNSSQDYSPKDNSPKEPITSLGQLAANETGPTSRLILTDEGVETPFLVLGYYGEDSNSVLLLREFLLKELSSFSLYDSQYYGGSVLDAFLNEEYLRTLPMSIQSSILDTSIEVTSKYSIESATSRDTEYISRKIFALSAAECGLEINRNPLVEGKPIQRLLDIENRISSLNGEYRTWWLRTPEPRNELAWTLQAGGMYCSVPIDFELGVRPAFCMSADTKINAVDKRENVYVLSH